MRREILKMLASCAVSCISPPSVIFISCIAETLKVLQINPALRGTASRNKLYHQCLHRRFKLVTLYAIVTFPKALYVLESLHYRTRSFLPPQSLIFPSIHPSLSVLSPRLPASIMCRNSAEAWTQCFDVSQDGALRHG